MKKYNHYEYNNNNWFNQWNGNLNNSVHCEVGPQDSCTWSTHSSKLAIVVPYTCLVTVSRSNQKNQNQYICEGRQMIFCKKISNLCSRVRMRWSGWPSAPSRKAISSWSLACSFSPWQSSSCRTKYSSTASSTCGKTANISSRFLNQFTCKSRQDMNHTKILICEASGTFVCSALPMRSFLLVCRSIDKKTRIPCTYSHSGIIKLFWWRWSAILFCKTYVVHTHLLPSSKDPYKPQPFLGVAWKISGIVT